MPAQPIKSNLRLSTRRPWLKINHGLVKLGRWGVCGMAWKWAGPGKPRGIEKFVDVMNKVPVATNKAFNTLWKHRDEICDELIELFERADKMDFDEFKDQVADLFASINVVVIALPNNYFGLQQGLRVDGDLFRYHQEKLNFAKALQIFQNDPNCKALFYQQFGLDLFGITEAQRRALCNRWEQHDYGITGRIVIEDINGTQGKPVAIDWMVNRMGRKDYYISRKVLEGISGFTN